MLIVPKDHYISIGALPESLFDEMNAFRRVLQSNLADCYGPFAVFEHGPSQERRTVGCGVDHAHLHLVPVSFDLATLARPLLPNGADWKLATIDECRNSFRRGEDYLYVEQPLGCGRIATGDMGSQVFRRAIASEIGSADTYNWREHPQLDNVMATVARMRTWRDSGAWGERGVLVAAA
jgi:hypothetical protein